MLVFAFAPQLFGTTLGTKVTFVVCNLVLCFGVGCSVQLCEAFVRMF